MNDPVSKEELAQAGKIICDYGMEAQLALQIVMTWFEENIDQLGKTMRARFAADAATIERLYEELREERRR